jgi:hypothetical protein
VKDALPDVSPALSLTVTLTLEVPAVVDVPAISPVLELIDLVRPLSGAGPYRHDPVPVRMPLRLDR